MTRDILLDLLQRQPFKPFAIKLSNDAQLTIRDPAPVRVGRNYLVVPGQRPELRLTITLHHILAVECEYEPPLEDYEREVGLSAPSADVFPDEDLPIEPSDSDL